MKTTDGGANWNTQTSGTSYDLRGVNFPADAQTGYAVGNRGTILKTTSGGASWGQQVSGILQPLNAVHFPVNVMTGYVVGDSGTILRTTDGGQVGVEQGTVERPDFVYPSFRVVPNPFASFAVIPGHEAERFALFDISGRRVGIFQGGRVGEGLSPGVYFLRHLDVVSPPTRLIKLK